MSATVYLGALTPEDMSVQILSGRVDALGEIKSPQIIPMRLITWASDSSVAVKIAA